MNRPRLMYVSQDAQGWCATLNTNEDSTFVPVIFRGEVIALAVSRAGEHVAQSRAELLAGRYNDYAELLTRTLSLQNDIEKLHLELRAARDRIAELQSRG